MPTAAVDKKGQWETVAKFTNILSRIDLISYLASDFNRSKMKCNNGHLVDDATVDKA